MYISYGERHKDGQLRWTTARNLTAAKRAAKYRGRQVFYTTEGTEHGPYGNPVATMYVWDDARWISS